MTTHSPLFCDAVLRLAKDHPKEIALLRVQQGPTGTEIAPFITSGPLFKDHEIAKALTTGTEDGLFENLILRGMIDE